MPVSSQWAITLAWFSAWYLLGISELVAGAGIEPEYAQLMRLAGNQHPPRIKAREERSLCYREIW